MGFGQFVDGIGDFILGGDDQGGLMNRTEAVFQKSLSAASLFGFKGDVADATTALTGRDMFTGQRVSGAERWMSVLGVGVLGGGVVGGARMADLGFPASSLLTRGRPQPRGAGLGSATFEITPGGRVSKENRAMDRALTRLNDEEGLSQPDLVFATTQEKTNKILKLDLDADLGGPLPQRRSWAAMASAVGASEEGAAQTAGFLEGVLAPRLLGEQPSAVAYQAARFDNPDVHADAKVVSFVVAQWEFANDWEKFKFKGEMGPKALREWRKLKNGQAVNSELLAEAMTKFAVATDWIQDPELRLNPMVAVSHINLDGERATMSLKALQWRQVPLDQLSGRAAQERLKALVEMHPSNMVFLMKDNLRQLMDQALQKPADVEWEDWMTDMRHTPNGIEGGDMDEMVRGWRNWYMKARTDLEVTAQQVRKRAKKGSSPHFADDEKAAAWLTVVASLTSAAEDWGTNVQKAADIADYLYSSKRAKTVAKMHSDINKMLGIKVPKRDLVKILLLDGFDDPMDIFRTGAKGTKADPGLNSDQLERLINAGADLTEIAPQRKIPPSWASLKQDSFAYAILKSRERDLEERAHYLSDMMRGELGAVLDQTPGGKTKVHTGTTQRTKLPVVADRQHFKASIGFSLVPDTWYGSGAGGGYDQFAQAARIVAGEMGAIDGRPVLPEEVQAITWMRYRAMSHYTDPMGRDWPKKADGAVFDRKELGQTQGYRRPNAKTATWVDGHGADLVFSNSVLKYLTGEAVAPLPSMKFVDAETDLTRYRSNPKDLRPMESRVTKNDHEEVSFEVAADGSVKWLAEEATLPRRGRYFSSATSNGKQVLMPSRAKMTRDATVEFDKIQEASREMHDPNRMIGTGAMLHADPSVRERLPFYNEGPMMSISSMSSFPDDFGSTSRGVHARALRELRKRGINFQVDDLPSHRGISLAWELPGGDRTWDPSAAKRAYGDDFMSHAVTDVEGRRERVFKFASVEDLHMAARFLGSTASDNPVVRGAHDFMATHFPERTYNRPDPTRFSDAYERKQLAEAQEAVADWYDTLPSGTGRFSVDSLVSGPLGAEIKQQEAMFDALLHQGFDPEVSKIRAPRGRDVVPPGVSKEVGDRLSDIQEKVRRVAVSNGDETNVALTEDPSDLLSSVAETWRSSPDLRAARDRQLADAGFPETITLIRGERNRAGLDSPIMNGTVRRDVARRFAVDDELVVIDVPRDAIVGWGHAAEAEFLFDTSRASVRQSGAVSAEVLESYEAMRLELHEQYRFVTEEMGIRMEATTEDPYANIAEAMKDVETNGRMKVLKTKEGEHPYFTPEENDMFRFVHDVFGHLVHENDFSRFGEEIAFATHMQMFSEAAQGALFTELRAQNGALIARGDFQPQRMGLPPDDVLNYFRSQWAEWSSDTWGRRLYRDEVADIRFYADHVADSPPGTSGYWEHHFTDDTGRTMVNINAAGGPHRSNSAQVWLLDNDLGGYLANQRSGRLDPGGVGSHNFDGNVWDNRLEFVGLEEGTTLKGNGKNLWGTTVIRTDPETGKKVSEHLHEFYITVQPGQAPMASLEPLGPESVRVTKTRVEVRRAAASGKASRSAFKLELPSPEGDGMVNPVVFDEIRELLVDTNDVGTGQVVVAGVRKN